jgi:hypothetical protein
MDPAGFPHQHNPEEWAEALTRTVAHLAAQLTITQVRLRAMATELEERGVIESSSVLDRMRDIAVAETGVYLHENLGEVLKEVIDVPALETEIIAFLGGASASG